MRVIIIGAGGHGQVVADILLRMQDAGQAVTPLGYLDEDSSLWQQKRLGLPVLGPLKNLAEIPHEALLVAIGHNQVRRQVFEQLKAAGEQFTVACHPSAVLAPDVTVGLGCMIGANVVVNPGASIGQNVILNTACTVDHHNRIGDHAHIAPGAHLGGDVAIGSGTLIGIGAIVMPQCSVGKECLIGAGAVVHQTIGDGATAVGVPARSL